MVTKSEVENALKNCFDPEIQIDIMTLGLVYNIDINNDVVNIKMTLTSIMCPYGPMLVEDAKNKVRALNGVKDVNVEITFDPPWEPSEEIKTMLGIG